MKKRDYWLWTLLLGSMAMVLCTGLYLKYAVLRPLNLLQDENPVALPFLYLSDPSLRESLQGGQTPSEPDVTVPSTAEPETAPPTTVPPTTVPPTTVPPTTGPVGDEWFDDALFIGDSRTVGLRDMARSGGADYFCSVGMSVFNAMTTVASDTDFQNKTLTELLGSRRYGKILIGLGINECGYPLEQLMSAYRSFVDKIRALQPDAKIILQGIMTVGRKKAAQASYFQVGNLTKINSEIEKLADGREVFYIDVNEKFADGEGYLPDALSSDGCHLYGKYDVEWEQWIREAVQGI